MRLALVKIQMFHLCQNFLLNKMLHLICLKAEKIMSHFSQTIMLSSTYNPIAHTNVRTLAWCTGAYDVLDY